MPARFYPAPRSRSPFQGFWKKVLAVLVGAGLAWMGGRIVIQEKIQTRGGVIEFSTGSAWLVGGGLVLLGIASTFYLIRSASD